MKLRTLVLLIGAGLALWCLAPAVADDAACADHPAALLGDEDNALSSPHIHKHREGILLPMGPSVSAVPLSAVNVEAEATFFSCMVRNFIINVRAEFVLDGAASVSAARLPVAFPLTTHALYGDHNRFRDITVSVDGAEIRYGVAMDYAVWSTYNDELRYKGRIVNYQIHPLLRDAKDLRLLAPHLVAEGFDLVLFWYMPAPGSISNRVVVEYTSNSNDFSTCCKEVQRCTHCSDPYHFYFDLGNARHWPGATACRVVLRDSRTAQWAGVPKTGMHTVAARDAIIMTGTNLPLEDIAVPVQPALFDSWPRTWDHSSGFPVQEFTLSWLHGAPGMIDNAVIDRIEATPGIHIDAELPIILNEQQPSATFRASYMPPVPDLAYIDVIGQGLHGQAQYGLYDSWLRIPLKGKTIMGHDLAVDHLWVQPGSSSSTWTVHLTVANRGLFTEPLLVTVLVNNVFVKTEGFRSLLPGDVVNLSIPLQWAWELPSDVEVEVEPSPGEVLRMNNSAAVTYPGPPEPRHASFVLRPDLSKVRFILEDSTRIVESKLLGEIRLFLNDPDVPAPEMPGTVGISVDGAKLVAPNFEPTASAIAPELPEPLYMHQNPCVHSVGWWNTINGEIQFELYLVTPDGELPAQQPTIFHGRLGNAGLCIKGLSSEPTAIPRMMMDIVAYEQPLPPKPDVWFSTEVGFHAANLLAEADTPDVIRYVSPGDLLSVRGHIVRTNHELTARLGIMPVVPDLGLDAAAIGPRREIWFSFEEEIGRIWSETLACWLKHGDLLSDAGRVIATNERLISRFAPMPPIEDVGLDAIAHACCRSLLFSTEKTFFSEALGRTVSHGDLLSTRGQIVQTNQQLMRNFEPIDPWTEPLPRNYGLDAVVLRSNGEIWFSTERGFNDRRLGPVSDGDLLSTDGYVVATNLELVSQFAPIEDLANFGLDAVNLIIPNYVEAYDNPSDVDGDGVVDVSDLTVIKQERFKTTTDENYRADVNDDGVIDVEDLTAVKRDRFKVYTACP